MKWKERKGKERKGKERKGKERKGKERKGKEISRRTFLQLEPTVSQNPPETPRVRYKWWGLSVFPIPIAFFTIVYSVYPSDVIFFGFRSIFVDPCQTLYTIWSRGSWDLPNRLFEWCHYFLSWSKSTKNNHLLWSLSQILGRIWCCWHQLKLQEAQKIQFDIFLINFCSIHDQNLWIECN